MISEYVDNVEWGDLVGDNSNNMQIVYQLTDKNGLKSIFKNGFSAEFAGGAGGNFYCKGLYTTTNLKSTLENLKTKSSLYGSCILKIYVPSFKGFLIFDRRIAKEVYGQNSSYYNQLKMFFPPEKIEQWKNSGILYRITNEHEEWTSKNVIALFGGLNGMGRSNQALSDYGVEGFLFKGHNDGHVCIIRDFKRVIPIAYSTDGGRTFKNDLFTKETFERSFKEYDPEIFLGKDAPKYINPQNYRMINNYMKVQRKSDKKYNFISSKDKNFLSPLWFDMASDMDSNHMAFVQNNGQSFYVGENGYYENENDDFPFATFDEV